MRITNLFGKISRAAGLTSVAPASRRRFFRRAMERKNRRPLIYRDKKEIPVELDKIMQRKSPDVTLEADDVFYVPDNKSRRTTFTVIDRITAFGSATASGLLIWH